MNDPALRSTALYSPADDAARTHRPIEFRWLIAAIGSLAVLYLAMLNRYWVPSGDGEVYTCIARSLVKGEGLKFNGFLAAIAPPGWPFVLSLAMRISPEFWFLKLVTTLSMVGAMGLAFLCVRRFVSDRVAAGIIFLSGTLSSVYPLTFWMHTEAFFCLLGFGMLLIAFRISEGVARKWEWAAMLVLLCAGALTRWPGVLQVVLIAPILYSGFSKPWRRAATSGLVLATFVVGIGTFLGTREALTLSKEERRLAIASGGTAEAEDAPLVELPADATQPTQPVGPLTDDAAVPSAMTFQETERGFVGELLYRIGVAGKWFAWLLWQPTRFGQSVAVINAAALITGWLTIALLAVTLFTRARNHRDFFWIGLAAYTGGLVVMWPNPNARYFVPVAPFIILGVILGLRALRGWRPAAATRPDRAKFLAGEIHASVPSATLDYGTVDRSARLARLRDVGVRVLSIVFVAALLLSNLPLLAIDIAIFRSRDFYANYEAGSNADLVAAAALIRQNPPPPGTAVVVSERYENMGRQRWSKFGVRAMHLLIDRPIVGAPRRSRNSTRPTDTPMRNWLRNAAGGAGASYYVYQTGWYPWRVWHFRLPGGLQSTLAKRRPSTQPTTQPLRTVGGWELWYRSTPTTYRLADLPTTDEETRRSAYPTRVPGL